MGSWRRVVLAAVVGGVAVALAVAFGLFGGARSTAAPRQAGPKVKAALARVPLAFVPNRGQSDRRVAYLVRGSRSSLYFGERSLTIALTKTRPSRPLAATPAPAGVSRYAVRLAFLGAKPVRPVGDQRLGGTVSYFTGPKGHWRSGIPTYARLRYRNLWPGIDLVYSGTGSRLEYSFLVKPGADPGRIRLAYQGQTSLTLDRKGALEVGTPLGGFRDLAPVASQPENGRRVPVEARYRLGGGGRFRFQLGGYDRTRPLLIDPVSLVYAGYLGGSGFDNGVGIAVDGAGAAYVTGGTQAPGFPVATGPDTSFNGSYDAFVAKVKPDGSGLDYIGYIGGSGSDEGSGIAVDGAGAAYITGFTDSNESSFPVSGGLDGSYNGGVDAFVAKVKPDGSGLDYAGYIGGSNREDGNAIAVDAAGAAYISGDTSSTESSFPVSGGPATSYNGGSHDAFVAKVKPDGSGLDYAGYIGGNGDDEASGIAVDASGAAYVGGYTSSPESSFPVSGGPDTSFNGLYDAFVAKVKPDGSGLDYAGYIGGSSGDFGRGIAVDRAGAAYITGYTSSDESTFPVTVGPDNSFNSGADDGSDAFVAKVKPDGSGLDYAGYIGGDDNDAGWGIAVDGSGAAYVSGQASSTEATFPVKDGPDLTWNGNDADAFVAKVKPDGSGLDYAGYIGSLGADYGHGIAVDAAGAAYVTGQTYADPATFPTSGGFGMIYNGGSDVFVAKVGATTANPDADGDGVVDAIDTGAGTFADTNTPPTTGAIVDAAGNNVLVSDAAASSDGVRITVTGTGTNQSAFTVCGFATLRLAPGSDVVVTCGSVKVNVVAGSAQIALDGGITVVTVPQGVTAKVSDLGGGKFAIADLGGGSLSVTTNGVTSTVATGNTSTVAVLTPANLCALTKSYIDSSAKYAALTAKQKQQLDSQIQAACNTLAKLTPKLTAKQKATLISAYQAAVTQLATQGWLTQSQAQTLVALSNGL